MENKPFVKTKFIRTFKNSDISLEIELIQVTYDVKTGSAEEAQAFQSFIKMHFRAKDVVLIQKAQGLLIRHRLEARPTTIVHHSIDVLSTKGWTTERLIGTLGIGFSREPGFTARA